MAEPNEIPNLLADPPQARLKQRRRRFPIIWLVPLVAALTAGYLLFQRVRDIGPEITITFKDASGVKAGQTDLEYRGVQIGEVRSVDLSRDRRSVRVTARLRRSAAAIARDGTAFWIVRIQGGIANLANLGTVISGPYIAAQPGEGKARKDFVGLDSAPYGIPHKDLEITLRAARLGSLRPGSPVYYRGIEVGAVQDAELTNDAAAVDIRVFVKQRYAKLVREGSRFWDASGVDVKFGLLRGLNVHMQSLRALATGGVAFATPDDPKARPAKDGTVFRLNEQPAKDWLAWRPGFAIAADDHG